MNFQRVDSRHYKRSDYKKGSNQFTKRRKLSGKTVLATLMLVSLLGYVGFVKVDRAITVYAAPKHIVSPLPQEITVVEAVPSAVPTQVEEFMKTQTEMNKKVVTWMQLQELHNDVVDDKLGGTN